MNSEIETEFISFYNKIKNNPLIINNYILSEPDIIEKIFMIDVKRKSDNLIIYDIHNPINEFTYSGISITYSNSNHIELDVLSLFNGDFFMEDIKEILYPNKIYNDNNILEQILKIYKVIEYLDYLVTYNDGKKVVDWNDWKDWNDYNF